MQGQVVNKQTGIGRQFKTNDVINRLTANEVRIKQSYHNLCRDTAEKSGRF